MSIGEDVSIIIDKDEVMGDPLWKWLVRSRENPTEEFAEDTESPDNYRILPIQKAPTDIPILKLVHCNRNADSITPDAKFPSSRDAWPGVVNENPISEDCPPISELLAQCGENPFLSLINAPYPGVVNENPTSEDRSPESEMLPKSGENPFISLSKVPCPDVINKNNISGDCPPRSELLAKYGENPFILHGKVPSLKVATQRHQGDISVRHDQDNVESLHEGISTDNSLGALRDKLLNMSTPISDAKKIPLLMPSSISRDNTASDGNSIVSGFHGGSKMTDTPRCSLKCEYPKNRKRKLKQNTGMNDLIKRLKLESKSWLCSSCFTRNDIGKTECIFCKAKIPHKIRENSCDGNSDLVDSEKSASPTWVCDICATTNSGIRHNCLSCDTLKLKAVSTKSDGEFKFNLKSTNDFEFGSIFQKKPIEPGNLFETSIASYAAPSVESATPIQEQQQQQQQKEQSRRAISIFGLQSVAGRNVVMGNSTPPQPLFFDPSFTLYGKDLGTYGDHAQNFNSQTILDCEVPPKFRKTNFKRERCIENVQNDSEPLKKTLGDSQSFRIPITSNTISTSGFNYVKPPISGQHSIDNMWKVGPHPCIPSSSPFSMAQTSCSPTSGAKKFLTDFISTSPSTIHNHQAQRRQSSTTGSRARIPKKPGSSPGLNKPTPKDVFTNFSQTLPTSFNFNAQQPPIAPAETVFRFQG